MTKQRKMLQKSLRVVMIVLACIIGVYPAIYFFIHTRFGLLTTKPDALLADVLWQVAFYVHIVTGGLALLSGWPQFIAKLRTNRLPLHRNMGKVYVCCVWVSAVAGIYIGFFATGGWPSAAGFVSLGVVWFYTTLMAYRHIKAGSITAHRQMMVYSYACTFAAVTLRIWLPILTITTGDMLIAYTIVAWLCWVPNLLIAWRINAAADSKERVALYTKL